MKSGQNLHEKPSLILSRIMVYMTNLLDALLRSSLNYGSNGFILLKKGKINKSLSYTELYECVNCLAKNIAKDIYAGERVGLAYYNELDFIKSFFAIQLSGGVPVPMAPPRSFSPLKHFVDKVNRICMQSRIRYIFVSERVLDAVSNAFEEEVNLKIVSLASYENEGLDGQVKWPLSEIALIQYTSGSVSKPKGVVVTHKNLITNIQSMYSALEMSHSSSGITWLPFYHDMGLIGCLLLPIYAGSDIYIMETEEFVRNPFLWLQALSFYSLAFSPAPNFAYKYCVERISESKSNKLDLSSWKVAINAAEPVEPSTMRAFSDKFGPVGFDEKAIMPLYGMAEATLGVTFPEVGSGLKTKYINRDQFSRGKIVVCDRSSTNVKEVVSCGSAIEHVQVCIYSEKLGFANKDLILGEICIKGESVCKMYDNDREATLRMFNDGWFKTGDIGFIVEEEIYIVGRNKEIMIINGLNYFANDIENIVQTLDGVLTAAAAPAESNGAAGVAIFVVTKSRSDQQYISHKIRFMISNILGLNIDEVVFVTSSMIPRTTSGKIDRLRVKNLLLNER